jgi:hypothetical protein
LLLVVGLCCAGVLGYGFHLGRSGHKRLIRINIFAKSAVSHSDTKADGEFSVEGYIESLRLPRMNIGGCGLSIPSVGGERVRRNSFDELNPRFRNHAVSWHPPTVFDFHVHDNPCTSEGFAEHVLSEIADTKPGDANFQFEGLCSDSWLRQICESPTTAR